MNTFCRLLFGAALLPVSLFAQEAGDSIADSWEKELELNEVMVLGHRTVVKQQEGKLVYLVKNDPYSKGLDGMTLLGRIPRVAVDNGNISVAGKGQVRYIIDGVLMELDASAMSMRLQGLRAENIERIELLTTPPSRYAAEPNAAYISITTRNEVLGTRGSIYGSLNRWDKTREYFSGSVSHTTRRLEMSVDASLSNYYSTNDNDVEYLFPDYSRLSFSSTDSHLFSTGANALLKYKITDKMNLGVITNYNYGSTTSNGANDSQYGNYVSTSVTRSKSSPNNALTITGFYDCSIGKSGEQMELTYNYFTRHSPVFSELSTTYSIGLTPLEITEEGASDYHFHSAKADFKLPRAWALLETGAAYTNILNSSYNRTQSHDGLECEKFEYRERIAAAYVTASRSLGKGLWGKAGLRYEHTWTRNSNYGRLFPTLNLSWNKERAGSFNISYSMGMGRPNLWELNPYRFYSTADEFAAGNPGLKPTLYNNAEINYYGLGGLYAVLYTSFASDAIGYIRRFDANGILSTMPYNCLSTNKTGVFASYKRNIFDWWEMKFGGEVFHSSTSSHASDYLANSLDDWSGKIEASASLMLNKQRTLIFSAQFTHFFPWQQNMVRYGSFQLFNLSLRYSLLDNRINLQLTANDIFGWNKTRSTEYYAGYEMHHTFDAHTSYVLLGISYRFGRDKVRPVWRDPKESQSSRTK